MATKIDTIQVGDVQYEITLPSTATPSIASLTVNGDTTIEGILSTAASATISKELTVGGDLTVSGTSVLASVSCTALSCSQSASIRYINSETLTVQNAIVRLGLAARSISCSGIICPTLNASINAGTLTVPVTSGTLARLEDFEPISETDINLLFI